MARLVRARRVRAQALNHDTCGGGATNLALIGTVSLLSFSLALPYDCVDSGWREARQLDGRPKFDASVFCAHLSATHSIRRHETKTSNDTSAKKEKAL